MQIVIEPVSGSRYRGTLIIDGEVVDTTIQPRPGCCARSLLNGMMMKHGKPTDQVVLEILSGW